jgi:3-oxoacyl-[acyl-carrier protein] reductase
MSAASPASRAGVALTFPPGAALVAGSGNIGAAVTRRLALAGVPVMFTYQKNAQRAQALQQEITGQGGDACALQLDFEDAVAVQRVVVQTAARHGRLHTVVYCSGPNIPFLRVRDMPAETLAYHFRADTLGCFRLFQHAIPVLEAGGGGSLTACVSMASHRALETDGLSAIPKAAVESLVRQIAAEEAGNRIRANAVPIGWVGGFAHSFQEARAYTAAMSGPEAPATRALMERIMSWIRMGRPGTGEEAANIVAFLASEQASYVTGCLLPADGGAIL